MSEQRLKNPPLIEAMLEVNWGVDTPDLSAVPRPVAFNPMSSSSLLTARFAERVRGRFPYYEALPNAMVPDSMIPGIVQHRFRKANGEWPVTQIGAGIMTVNETKGYTWSGFKPLCEELVNTLYDVYPDGQTLNIQNITLRYIDAVPFDFARNDVFVFLREKMKTSILLPSDLCAKTGVTPSPLGFNWQTSFSYKGTHVVTLHFYTGLANGVNSLLWDTMVATSHNSVPSLPEEFPDWVEIAHEVTHNLFFNLIEGALREEFDK